MLLWFTIFLKSRTLSRISEIKMYKTILKSVVMYGCEAWSSSERKVSYVKYAGDENSTSRYKIGVIKDLILELGEIGPDFIELCLYYINKLVSTIQPCW
jgi:hypothetical protein